jgi:hypothetical protein
MPIFKPADAGAKSFPNDFKQQKVTGQVRLHFFPQTTVQNFLDSGI